MDYNKHDGAVTNVCNSPLFYPYAFVEKIRFALASPCPSCPTPPRVAAPSTPYPATRRRTLHSLPRHKRRGAYLPERLLLSERLLSFAQEDKAQRGASISGRLLLIERCESFDQEEETRRGGLRPACMAETEHRDFRRGLCPNPPKTMIVFGICILHLLLQPQSALLT